MRRSISIPTRSTGRPVRLPVSLTETTRRLIGLRARVITERPNEIEQPILKEILSRRQETIRRTISQRNATFFEAEADKLGGWADDLKVGLEREIKDLDRQIKEARRSTKATLTLEDKLAGQKQVKALET
ncbi:MAG: hypothetical protein C3F12_02535 [Candidatus Methylomirabilota bacterium]|nr:MAG: hypothetical protein C3F12_02535 [candidate division NC10 bacterium]